MENTESEPTEINAGQSASPLMTAAAMILPFVVYMVVGMWEPQQNQDDRSDPNRSDVASSSESETPVVDADRIGSAEQTQANRAPDVISKDGLPLAVFYTVRCAVTLLTLAFFLSYYRALLLTPGWLAVVVGIAGFLLWTGVCSLNIEASISRVLGFEKWFDSLGRSALQPFEIYAGKPLQLYWFMSVRILALVLVVPIVEELFLRGFICRFFVSEKWWEVSLSDLPLTTYAIVGVYAVCTHPGEAVAAVLWFSLVTALMMRTGRLTDCIVAHATTNLLLGVYVVSTGSWQLW